MINKGIILAGGSGTRLSPLTKAVNKQLLPIYDKPLIFYPLSILMLANIKNILMIVNPGQIENFKSLLGDGKRFGIKIQYKIQKKPKGLADAFILGKSFIKRDNVALILGDNFFYGQSLTDKLEKSLTHNKGARIFLKNVKKPENFGVAKIVNKKIKKIVEKPKKTNSNLIITGLYVFDKKVVEYAKNLRPSKRGEIEMVDLINIYKKKNKLNIIKLGRGSAWMDVGNFNDLHSASNFIQNIEDRQSFKIGCLEEIALNNRWIDKENIISRIESNRNNFYSNYLKKLIKKNVKN